MSLATPTFLITEDNKISAALLARSLKNLYPNCDCFVCQNAEEFLEVYQLIVFNQKQVDLIFMDLHLGLEAQSDGLALAQQHNTLSIPCVFTSAYSLNEAEVLTQQKFTGQFLAKPIDPKDLQALTFGLLGVQAFS